MGCDLSLFAGVSCDTELETHVFEVDELDCEDESDEPLDEPESGDSGNDGGSNL